MGAKADIDAALEKLPGGPAKGWRIVLGNSAATAFLADLYHDGILVPPDPDGRGREEELPAKYRGHPIEITEEFDGWSLEEKHP